MLTCPLKRYLKLLNLLRQRTDMLLIHLNLIAKRVKAMTIGSSMDLRNPKNVAWLSSAMWQYSSSWLFQVQPLYDDDTLNKDLLVSYKDTVLLMIPSCQLIHYPSLATLMSSCSPPLTRMKNWSNLLNFDDDLLTLPNSMDSLAMEMFLYLCTINFDCH